MRTTFRPCETVLYARVFASAEQSSLELLLGRRTLFVGFVDQGSSFRPRTAATLVLYDQVEHYQHEQQNDERWNQPYV